MYLAAAIDATQEINRGITGVTTAPPLAELPDQVNEVECPFAFTWPRKGRWDYQAIGLDRNDMLLVITVLVAPVGVGIRGDVIAKTVALLDRFMDAYLDPENDDLGETIEHLEALMHDGLQPITYGGKEFFGFQIQVPGVAKRPSL